MKSGPKIKPLARNDDELQLVNLFLAEGLSQRTVQLYMTALRKIQTWCASNEYTLDTIPVHALIEYADTLPFTWSSRQRLRVALNHYWRITGRVAAPIKAVRVPKKPLMRPRALDEVSAAKLASAARERRDAKGAIVLLGLQVGLRREEIASLRWSDFDDDSLSWVTVTGKNDVTAYLPVHPHTQAALNAIRPGEVAGEWVFPGSDGHVSPATIWAWARQAAEEAGVGRVTTHVLRHTCLTEANDRTRDLRAVQAFARHQRPETTAGYTRVNKTRLVEVMNALNYEEAG